VKVFQLHYSEALIRRAVWAFWRRVVGWRFVGATAFVLACLIYNLWLGDRSWWVGVSGSLVGFALLVALALYVVHYRGSIGRFRRMKSPHATFEASEERFRVSSDVGASEFSWSVITEVWQFEDFWLLFFSRGQFITLPLADLDSDARHLIAERIREHGGKVS
jgi:hypothetical protein